MALRRIDTVGGTGAICRRTVVASDRRAKKHRNMDWIRARGRRLFRREASPSTSSTGGGAAAPDPASAALLVCISFHYALSRLPYLLEVVRTLADFPVRRLDVVVLTNAVGATECDLVNGLLRPHLGRRKTLEVLGCPGLEHPFDLTWCHKTLIVERFLAEGSRYSHFIYLEDDMRFGYANFSYFVEYRPLLSAKGLIPSFVRTELNLADGKLYPSDFPAGFAVATTPSEAVGDYLFCGTEFPYCALYVLDRTLAREYVASRSFDREASKAVVKWGVRERAAMGLCWESPPPGFATRFVLPVRRRSGRIWGRSWVGHLPGNYANDPKTIYAKIPIERLAKRSAPAGTGK